MINLNSLYVLFFAITVGAFSPTEASSVPLAINTGVPPSPGEIAFSADQHQQNNNVTPVQKESSQGPLQQKKTRLSSVLAAAGATALVLAFVFFFMKYAEHIKAYIPKEKEEEEVKPEDVVDQPKLTPEEEHAISFEMRMIGAEIGFEDEAMTEDEIRAEAKRRIRRRGEIYDEMMKKDKHGKKKEEEIRKAAYKEEAWERKEARGRRYQYTPDRAEFEQEFEEDYNEREIRVEMEVIGEEIGFEDEAMTEDEIRAEAKKRVAARKDQLDKIRCAAGAEGKTESELIKRAHKNEAWQRQREKARKRGAEAEWDQQEFDEEWGKRLRKHGLLLGQKQKQ